MNPAHYLDQFKQPDPRYTPVPAWWWSGEPLHWPKMKWQMDQMRAMGLRNFVVIGLAPSGAMFGSDADEPAFLSEPWWELFGKVCDYAAEIGMFVWFYDQIGFSGANFQTDLVAAHPEWSAERLKSISIKGQGELRLTCPNIGTPIRAYLLVDGQITDVALNGRNAAVTTEQPGTLRIVYSVKQAYDYFNPVACQALLDTVHREYARRFPQHIGKTIVGSFQDELPELPTWGPTFADSFADAFGYRLEPVIHRLFEEGDADARRTRVHYHQHRANLAEKAFFKPFFDWYESYGMQCGYDQQSPAREARVLGCIEKYADYMQTQKWYALPGSDLHGNGKLHSSIAFLNDRPRVWLEGFHTSGWGGTIADTFDWLLPYLQSGVTLYNPHAIYYSTRKGWWEWAPPSTCWRQPYAMHYAGFSDMIARLTKLLSRGVQQASVGVLFPTATAQSGIGAEVHFASAKQADQMLHEVIGSMRWHQVKTGALDGAAIDHHILDEAAIQNATLDGDNLIVHGVPLRAIVLPAITFVQESTLARLKAFSAAGGRVIVVGAETVETNAGRPTRWDSIPGITIAATAKDIGGLLADLHRPVSTERPFLHRRDGDLNILFVPAVSGMATVVKWDSWFAPMEHTTIVPERYAASTVVTLTDHIDQVLQFDPIDGTYRPLATMPGTQGVTVRVDFDAAPMAVLVWSSSGLTEVPAAVSNPALPQKLADAWRCDYVPTLPEPFADIYDADRPEQRWPTTPAVRWMTGPRDGSLAAGLPESAERVLATFGPRGWVEFDDGRREPLVYSPLFGIEHDKLHQLTLGPKGHVPEEFIDLGKLTAGASATVYFGVYSDRRQKLTMSLGANAKWQLKSPNETVESDDGYAALREVTLNEGENRFAWTLTARGNANVRAFWCFVDDAGRAASVRPERLITPQKPAFGQRLRFSGVLNCAAATTHGTLFVATAAQAQIFVDGRLLGRQGGFDPYRLQMRGQRYELPPLAAGEHEIAVLVASPASIAPVAIEAEAFAADGRVFRVASNASFRVSIDDAIAVPVAIQPKQDADGAAWHLHRRPHPLPQTKWLDGGRPGVIELKLVPPLESARTQWLAWTTPPGATLMRVPLVECEDVAVWIDGQPVTWPAAGEIRLPDGDRPPRKIVICVTSRQMGGGLLAGPVTYQFSTGALRPGSWMQQGLESYSGAIRMTANVHCKSNALTELNLGQVRGTVEAFINGESAGVRFMPPYRFKIAGLLKQGENAIELIVTNTLVNHLSTWSPTRCWSPDQLETGVMGPVELR